MKTMKRASELVGAGAIAMFLLVGPGVGTASAASDVGPWTIPIGNIGRLVLLPPSPCRPSESGGERCIAIGSVAQIYLLPPSPCTGPVCLRPPG